MHAHASRRATTLTTLALACLALHCSSSSGSGTLGDAGQPEHETCGAGESCACVGARCVSDGGADARSPSDARAPGDAGEGGDGAKPKDGGADGGTVPIVPAFYVSTKGSDGNAGTLKAPFLTFAKAQSAMQGSKKIKTTYVRAGDYTLPTIADCGGSSCGIFFTSADDGETLSYYPPDGVDSAVLDAGSKSPSTGLNIAIYVGANQLTINGLTIHGFQYAGINSGGGTVSLLVENNVLYDGYTASGSSNPAAVSCYGCNKTTISHNVFHDIAQFGVSMSNVNGDISDLLVTGNVFYNTCNAIADCGALYVQDTKAIATNIVLSNNYIHDGNTFATLGSGSGSGVYADDCTSNVTASGNVLTGRNGSNTMHVHGGSNVHYDGNLTDLGTYGQHLVAYQTSGVSACSSAVMSGNEYEHNIVLGAGGGGGFALLSGTPMNAPSIDDNDYFSYGSSKISSGGSYTDSDPSNLDPMLSGWDYAIAAGSPVYKAPVKFTALVGGWGPPGYVLPETGTPPSSPH